MTVISHRRTFSLPHRQQAVLVAVAEWPLGHRLEVAGVNSSAGNRVAALTHAGVIAQAAFVQVRVGEGIAARDPFGLHVKRGEGLPTHDFKSSTQGFVLSAGGSLRLKNK